MTEPMDLATYLAHERIGRQNWHCLYRAASVKEYADHAREYHRARQRHWEDRRDAAKQKLGAEGLDVREQSVTGGKQYQTVLDPALQADLTLAVGKVDTHRNKADQLAQWAGFLGALGDSGIILTFADIDFFEIGKHEGDFDHGDE